ncbi:hypothetical protein D9M68_690720 [compost metagenome]
MNAIANLRLPLSDAVRINGEKSTFDQIVSSVSGTADIDASEVAGLAILGLRYLARGAQPYDPDGEQQDHDEILSAHDLLRIYKRRRRACNWWDDKRIDGAVSTFVNLSVMSFDEGNEWYREKLRKLEKDSRKAKEGSK